MARRFVSLALVGIGLLLITFAYWHANSIPQDAVNDSSAWVRATGGSTSPGFSETYMRMSANRRILQNAYIGGSGMALLVIGVGAFSRRH
jgi:hypothetical protein